MENQRDPRTGVINIAFTLGMGILFGYLLNLTFGESLFNVPVIGTALGICIGVLSSGWINAQKQKKS